MLPLLVLLGTIAGAWYLLIVRPQRDQQTRHGALIEQLRVGDHVLTVGGIYGRILALEGASVVLELAPGMTSRIATDGIARVVQEQVGAPLGAPTPSTSPATSPQHVQHIPPTTEHVMHQPPNDTYPAPTFSAPQTPFVQQQIEPIAHVAPIASASRPWTDVAPVASSYHAQPIFGATPVTMQPPAVAVQPLTQQPPVTAPPIAVAEPVARRHSLAPQGMGSSLRLDDPSIRDTVARARTERAQLAEELHRASAPLVDVTPQAAHYEAAPVQAVPSYGVPSQAAEYPTAVRPATSMNGVPRPGVQPMSPESVDPAFRMAFQHRTPLTAPVAQVFEPESGHTLPSFQPATATPA